MTAKNDQLATYFLDCFISITTFVNTRSVVECNINRHWIISWQFVDHYQPFTPEQLKYLPLNTALKAPPTDIKLSDIGRPKPKTGNYSYSTALESDTSSSSESDTGSESSYRYGHQSSIFATWVFHNTWFDCQNFANQTLNIFEELSAPARFTDLFDSTGDQMVRST